MYNKEYISDVNHILQRDSSKRLRISFERFTLDSFLATLNTSDSQELDDSLVYKDQFANELGGILCWELSTRELKALVKYIQQDLKEDIK